MFPINWKSATSIFAGVAGVACIAVTVYSLFDETTKYDDNGFDADGYDRDGYNRDGFNRHGRDRQGYDAAGFNAEGFDRRGFDSDGYNQQGYDADGYDRSGRNKRGYDRNGYDHNGFNRFGLDAEGFNRRGYDRDGFNRSGYDRYGYGRDYYNASGVDRAGYSRDYYADHLDQLHIRLDEAHKQLKRGEYRYAVYDARIVMEETLRMIVQHALGPNYSDDKMLVNLKICEKKQLLKDADFLNNLHSVRRICNDNGHNLDAGAGMSHKKVHFVVMQTRDLLGIAEQILVTQQKKNEA